MNEWVSSLKGKLLFFDVLTCGWFAAFMESNTSTLLQVHSLDDSFIELMAMGRIIHLNDKMHLQAASVEGLMAELIQVQAQVLNSVRNFVESLVFVKLHLT